MGSPSNFSFLGEPAPLLADPGLTAETLNPFDPASGMLRSRLMGDAVAQEFAARLGLRLGQPTRVELLRMDEHRPAAQRAEQQLAKGRGLRKASTTA